VISSALGAVAGSLPGGEQQMPAVARASFVSVPQILLREDPSMGLALKVVDGVFRVMAENRVEGTTVVLIDQNPRRAVRASEHGYVLQSGSMTHAGPAQKRLVANRIVKAYLGVWPRALNDQGAAALHPVRAAPNTTRARSYE
jgi:branched-chain amino acid transport system ATP-binding protein